MKESVVLTMEDVSVLNTTPLGVTTDYSGPGVSTELSFRLRRFSGRSFEASVARSSRGFLEMICRADARRCGEQRRRALPEDAQRAARSPITNSDFAGRYRPPILTGSRPVHDCSTLAARRNAPSAGLPTHRGRRDAGGQDSNAARHPQRRLSLQCATRGLIVAH